MLINLCYAFEPHEPHVTLVEYEMYLRLFIFLTWIKIPDGKQMVQVVTTSTFRKITRLAVNQSMCLCWSYHEIFYILLPQHYCKDYMLLIVM
jgi:hypothetical protein